LDLIVNGINEEGRSWLLILPTSLSFYDALIVASALETGYDRLYSEDLQDGRRFAGLAIISPFIP
jgi:predicted nucleic acid-binding protein